LLACLSAFFLQIKRSIALDKEKKEKKVKKEKLEITTNNQENNVQQELFDLETKRKIQESLQEIYNKQQRHQQATNGSGGRNGGKGSFIKVVNDGELKRLSFTGQFQKEQVPYKDNITNQK
jgi:hypothetical protein